MKLKVRLGIGYANANHEDVIDIPDEEVEACKTDEEREELFNEACYEWAGNYIETWFEVVK